MKPDNATLRALAQEAAGEVFIYVDGCEVDEVAHLLLATITEWQNEAQNNGEAAAEHRELVKLGLAD